MLRHKVQQGWSQRVLHLQASHTRSPVNCPGGIRRHRANPLVLVAFVSFVWERPECPQVTCPNEPLKYPRAQGAVDGAGGCSCCQAPLTCWQPLCLSPLLQAATQPTRRLAAMADNQ